MSSPLVVRSATRRRGSSGVLVHAEKIKAQLVKSIGTKGHQWPIGPNL